MNRLPVEFNDGEHAHSCKCSVITCVIRRLNNLKYVSVARCQRFVYLKSRSSSETSANRNVWIWAQAVTVTCFGLNLFTPFFSRFLEGFSSFLACSVRWGFTQNTQRFSEFILQVSVRRQPPLSACLSTRHLTIQMRKLKSLCQPHFFPLRSVNHRDCWEWR